LNAPAAVQQRRLRALQTTDAPVTIIQYIIVDPSVNLLALDTTTFNTLVSADPAIVSIATIVGSSGVSATAPEELVLTAAAVPVTTGGAPTPQDPSSQTAQLSTPIYVAIGVTAGAALISMFAAAVAIALRMRPAASVSATPAQKTTVVFVDTANPLMVSKSKDVRVLNDKLSFGPTGAGARV
jgi:hypothetical protein